MSNRVRVIKIGGEIAQDQVAVETLFSGIASINKNSAPVLVHGGGALASSIARQYGRPAEMIAGRRITSAFDLQTILWSVCGEVNTTLVAAAARHGLQAVGLTGADAQMICADRRPPVEIDGSVVDFGFVGDIVSIQPNVILALRSRGYLPVIATLGMSDDGVLLNINADTVASRLATALSALSLTLVTPTGAVRRDPEDPATALAEISQATFDDGVQAGWIRGGMRVKLEEAFRCRASGVGSVVVADVAGIASGAGTRLV